MKYSGSSFSYLFVDGFNLAPAIQENVTVSDELLTEQTNPFGVDSEEHSPIGIQKGTMSMTGGIFDEVTDTLHNTFGAEVGIFRIVAALIGGNVAGSPFFGFAGVYDQKYDIIAKRDGLTRANVNYIVSGDIDTGVVVQPFATFTADWDTKTGGLNAADSPVDNLVSSTNGGAGYLQVTAFAGFSGVVMKIMHSPDDITYAPLVTFVTVAGVDKQRIEVLGTIDRYLSSNGDVTGVGSISVFTGFARN